MDKVSYVHENCCPNVFWMLSSSHKIHVLCVILCIIHTSVYALSYSECMYGKYSELICIYVNCIVFFRTDHTFLFSSGGENRTSFPYFDQKIACCIG